LMASVSTRAVASGRLPPMVSIASIPLASWSARCTSPKWWATCVLADQSWTDCSLRGRHRFIPCSWMWMAYLPS